MRLEIITPENVLLRKNQVIDVKVPGVDGEFQLLDNHAPIISILQKGTIAFNDKVELSEDEKDSFKHENGKYLYKISGGVIENKENKTVILVD